MILQTLLEAVNPYPKYLFRVCPGPTPTAFGSWYSKNKDADDGTNASDCIYTSPALYPWIHHYFGAPDVEKVFAIIRPSNLNPKTTICSGINSTWHYVFLHKDTKTINYIKKCIINHNFDDPLLKQFEAERNEMVMKHFGKPLSKMKGGLYLGTLEDWDKNIRQDGYPEVIIQRSIIKKCPYEQLICKNKTTFIGKASRKVFKLEFPI